MISIKIELDIEVSEPTPPDNMPERALWCQSLAHGIHDACKHNQYLYWLLSDKYYVGSYVFHCEAVGLCHKSLRTKVLQDYDRIRKKKNARLAEILRGYTYKKVS